MHGIEKRAEKGERTRRKCRDEQVPKRIGEAREWRGGGVGGVEGGTESGGGRGGGGGQGRPRDDEGARPARARGGGQGGRAVDAPRTGVLAKGGGGRSESRRHACGTRTAPQRRRRGSKGTTDGGELREGGRRRRGTQKGEGECARGGEKRAKGGREKQEGGLGGREGAGGQGRRV